ncbi:hypothetical protein ACLI09_06770 [Flavobacterium sp. RHBU_24]|uniref:hypothetical protein n=1 Tax=Flavobacterium sp. RHBU_24 TaxID=3391185 RepID=UPI0039848C38
MKRIICIAAVIFCITITHAQDAPAATVEKSVFNVQTGFLGLYANNEYGLSNHIALRTEVGLEPGFTIRPDDSEWSVLPMINLEPRYYYNIEKRAGKGRNVSGNAASFFTVSVRCNPDLVLYSTQEDAKMATFLGFVPKWGIRRNIGQSKFNYEAGIGIGYYTLLGNDKKYYDETEGVALDLHLRIGYRF